MYEKVCAAVNPAMPWWFVAVIHQLESGGDFTKHLHNGDSLLRRTKNVPAGRPATGEPPFSWMASAEDALKLKGYHTVRDWSLPHALWLLECYNGLGYRLHRGIYTPYLWAGTNHYHQGKYIADGVWDSSAKSKQPGAAGLIKTLL